MPQELPEMEEGDQGEQSPPAMAKPKRWRYNSPLAQVSLIGLVCFCLPGMYNALNGLGGGGQADHAVADNANTALYACFAVFGVVGGAVHNLLGPRVTLLAGSLTYPLYVASFLYYSRRPGGSQAFPVAAGALLGAGAGLLWAAQGAILTSYPPPGRRGAYIALFWCLFNLGSVLGGLLPLSLNFRRGRSSGSVGDGTYVAFMALMLAGVALTLLFLPPRRIVRDDGSRVVAAGGASSSSFVDSSSWRSEAGEMLRLLGDWRMLLLLAPAWASNFFYTYQFNNVNGLLFTLRTRGLNNVAYWSAQMLGSAAIGYLLDHGGGRRRRRGLLGVAAVVALGTAIWGGGFASQLRHDDKDQPAPLIDFKDGGRRYGGPFLLYCSYGLLDAMFQSLIYWVIGALTNDGRVLSRYAGLYKGVQSAGAAVAWQVDMQGMPLMTQLLLNWGLMTASYPLLALLVFLAVKDDHDQQQQQQGNEEEKAAGSTPA